MNDIPTSLTLIQRAKQKDNSAWERIRELYAPLIYYWCRQRQVLGPDVEEIHTNVVGKAFDGLPGFQHNGNVGAFRGWLRTITRNEIALFRREVLDLVDPHLLTEKVESKPQAEDTASEEKKILHRRAWELIKNEHSQRDQELVRRVWKTVSNRRMLRRTWESREVLFTHL